MSNYNLNSKEPFDYFICYCGKDMYEGSITKKFAYALYNKLIGCGKKVYFAPETGHGDAYNSDEMLKEMMNNLTTSFIVLLSPNFFNDFDEQDGDNESPRKKELSVALAEARNRKETLTSEITDFLKYVHIDGFKWHNSYKFLVKELFGNYPLSDYFHISAFNKINKTTKDIMSLGRYEIDSVIEETVKIFIKENLCIDIELEHSIEKYRHDMNLCFHSVMAEKKSITFNDFLERNQEVTHPQEEKIKYCDRENSIDLISRLGFKNTDLTYWPVFFKNYISEVVDYDSHNKDTAQNNKIISISTCAVCLGALQILHWLSVDKSRDSKDNQDKRLDYVCRCFRDFLRGSIELIVLMRNENGAWPAQRCLFDNNKFKNTYEQDNHIQ